MLPSSSGLTALPSSPSSGLAAAPSSSGLTAVPSSSVLTAQQSSKKGKKAAAKAAKEAEKAAKAAGKAAKAAGKEAQLRASQEADEVEKAKQEEEKEQRKQEEFKDAAWIRLAPGYVADLKARRDLGYPTEAVITASLTNPLLKYPRAKTRERLERVVQDVFAKRCEAAGLPGVALSPEAAGKCETVEKSGNVLVEWGWKPV